MLAEAVHRAPTAVPPLRRALDGIGPWHGLGQPCPPRVGARPAAWLARIPCGRTPIPRERRATVLRTVAPMTVKVLLGFGCASKHRLDRTLDIPDGPPRRLSSQFAPIVYGVVMDRALGAAPLHVRLHGELDQGLLTAIRRRVGSGERTCTSLSLMSGQHFPHPCGQASDIQRLVVVYNQICQIEKALDVTFIAVRHRCFDLTACRPVPGHQPLDPELDGRAHEYRQNGPIPAERPQRFNGVTVSNTVDYDHVYVRCDCIHHQAHERSPPFADEDVPEVLQSGSILAKPAAVGLGADGVAEAAFLAIKIVGEGGCDRALPTSDPAGDSDERSQRSQLNWVSGAARTTQPRRSRFGTGIWAVGVTSVIAMRVTNRA